MERTRVRGNAVGGEEGGMEGLQHSDNLSLDNTGLYMHVTMKSVITQERQREMWEGEKGMGRGEMWEKRGMGGKGEGGREGRMRRREEERT